MATDDDDAATLRERVRDLEATVAQQQDTIEQLLPSRRAVLAGGAGLVGGAALTGQVSAQSAAGQVGTSSEPVDVEAATVSADSVNTESTATSQGTVWDRSNQSTIERVTIGTTEPPSNVTSDTYAEVANTAGGISFDDIPEAATVYIRWIIPYENLDSGETANVTVRVVDSGRDFFDLTSAEATITTATSTGEVYVSGWNEITESISGMIVPFDFRAKVTGGTVDFNPIGMGAQFAWRLD